MASEAAARSHWVGEEVAWWLANRSPQRLLIVVTDGAIGWDAAAGDFDWSRTSCLPRTLAGRFTEEPLFVDLRWAKDRDDLSLRHARFRAALLDLAAPLHGRPKDALDSEDIRQHRRQRLVGTVATATIALLGLVAVIAGWQAVQNERRAVEAARIAEARPFAARARLGVREGRIADAAALALQAHAIADTAEGRAALFQLVQASWDYQGVLVGAGNVPVEALAFRGDAGPLLGFDRQHGVQAWDGRFDGRIALLELRDGRALVEKGLSLETPNTLGHEFAVGGLAFSPDGRFLAADNVNPSALVGLWSMATGRLVGSFNPSTAAWVNQSVAIAQLPGGDGLHKQLDTYLVVGTSNGSVLTWRESALGRFEPVQSAQPRPAAVLALAVHGGALASGGIDGGVSLAGDPQQPAVSPTTWTRAPVRSLAFSADGRTLAAGTGDTTVLLPDAQAQRPRSLDSEPFEPAAAAPTDGAGPSPGGRLVVTREARSLRCWRPGPAPRTLLATIPLPAPANDDDPPRLL